MKRQRSPEEDAQRLLALMEEMADQSDRGAAIIGAAWVEEAILAALESFLYAGTRSWDRLFDSSGPLSAFSAKIDLAHVLGLTTDGARSDLHMIREVRNEFAHEIAHKNEHKAFLQ
jgi:hypothetical protein